MEKNSQVIKYLATRRSVPAGFLQDPGPTKDELDQIISIGLRVPDHGKLNPWRLLVISGEARERVGQKLAQIARNRKPDMDEKELETERRRLLPAPVVIGVISSPVEHAKIPEFEQLMSAAAVALNLVHGANAFGYGAYWLTRWYAYDEEATKMFGLEDGERFVGFVHMGTAGKRLEDKRKPDVEKLVTYWDS